MREFWEARYAEAQYAYGMLPNRFLVECEPLLPRGARILLPGDGEGRNGVWLAARGHAVTSVDQAESGLQKARALAESMAVSIETARADLASWEPAPSGYDAVVLIYLHLLPALRRGVHRKLGKALRPGGLLILEGFERSHLGLPGGGPSDPAMLFDQETLAGDFEGFSDLVFSCVELDLDEGPSHHGLARVIRGLGRAP